MISPRSVPFLTAFGIIVMLAVGVWLLTCTPGTLVDDGPERFGVAPEDDAPTIIVSVPSINPGQSIFNAIFPRNSNNCRDLLLMA